MKFRTKIWSLPASAALVFIIGVVISAAIGARRSDGIDGLRLVDDPFLARVTQVDLVMENVRLTVQTATAEGDSERLKDVHELVKTGHAALDAMALLPGKEDDAKALRVAFDAYQSAATLTAKGMIDKRPDAMELVQKMAMAASINSLRRLKSLIS